MGLIKKLFISLKKGYDLELNEQKYVENVFKIKFGSVHQTGKPQNIYCACVCSFITYSVTVWRGVLCCTARGAHLQIITIK